jgi:hypothetical protein
LCRVSGFSLSALDGALRLAGLVLCLLQCLVCFLRRRLADGLLRRAGVLSYALLRGSVGRGGGFFCCFGRSGLSGTARLG